MKLKSADTAFSRYVRQRDANEFDCCKCPITKYYSHWENFVCGHYIKRRILVTRWHPDNAFAISPEANLLMETDSDIATRYGLWILEKIGTDRYSELMALRMTQPKITQSDIDEIAAKYRNQY